MKPVKEALRGSHDGIVPVLERVDHALEVERESSFAHPVAVVRLEQNETGSEDGAEERELNVADPKTRRLDVGGCDKQ